MKAGLDYFSLDVDMSQDDKIFYIEAKHGPTAFAIIIKLLMRIYREGYFSEWGEKQQLIFSRKVNVDNDYLSVVVDDCIEEGLFDEDVYNQYGVLTSRGIQKRYLDACVRRKEVEIDARFLLIDTEKYANVKLINAQESECAHDETPCTHQKSSSIDNVDIDHSSTSHDANILEQSKVKESKVKKSKENNHHKKDADFDAAHADNVINPENMDSAECASKNQGRSVSIFSFAEEQFARPLKKAECTLLDNFLQTYPFELIQEAISRAVLNQATNLRYVQSILRSWSDKGITCLAEVEQEDKRFQKRKTYKTKGKDAKLKVAKEARSSPGESKIPDYYKIYEKRSAGG